MRIVLLLTVVLGIMLIAPAFAQEFNPKSVDSISMRITQAGELNIAGDVHNANISLYIPQEGISDIKVSSNSEMNWHYGSDGMGNRVVVMQWPNPSGVVDYTVQTTVTSTAKFVNPTSDIGYDPVYLNETKNIILSNDIRKAAYPYERSWDNVAYLTQYVYDTMTYDPSLAGQRMPSDWVMENRRGVCVEYSNLLAALLRASDIPTRYVVGYAYSSVDKKLIGHAWVEVLSGDGTWVPFDPTWLEGGYLDATHIKTGNLLDDSQIDVLTYTGSGKIAWTRNSGNIYADSVEIINYTLHNITSIDLEEQDTANGGYGYVKATVRPNACLINQLKIQSCVDQDQSDFFEIAQKEREFFSCFSKDVYWFLKAKPGKNSFICPVNVFDQIGSAAAIDVKTSPSEPGGAVSISGPDVVQVGERFTLSSAANGDFIFYSPDFGRSLSTDWNMRIIRPGQYEFYLYAGGALATKTISVVQKKEFNLTAQYPSSAQAGSNFTINVTATNLETSKTAVLTVEFDGSRTEKQVGFGDYQQKIIPIALTAKTEGQQKLSVSLQADSFTPFSAYVAVEKPRSTSIIDGIAGAIKNFLGAIKQFFEGIFGGK